jgi:hypothetical protein
METPELCVSARFSIEIHTPVRTSTDETIPTSTASTGSPLYGIYRRSRLVLGCNAGTSLHGPYLDLAVERPCSLSIVISVQQERTPYPDARYSPVGLQASEKIQEECPERLKTCSPETTSNTATRVESPQTANSFPPGENFTARMGLTKPI